MARTSISALLALLLCSAAVFSAANAQPSPPKLPPSIPAAQSEPGGRKLLQASPSVLIQGGGPSGGFLNCPTLATVPSLCFGTSDKAQASQFIATPITLTDGSNVYQVRKTGKFNVCLSNYRSSNSTEVNIFLYNCYPAASAPWYQLWGYNKLISKNPYTNIKIYDTSFWYAGAGKAIQTRTKCDAEQTAACRFGFVVV